MADNQYFSVFVIVFCFAMVSEVLGVELDLLMDMLELALILIRK